jgi:hypothetical protein
MEPYNGATTKATVVTKLKLALSRLPAAVNVGITLSVPVALLPPRVAFSPALYGAAV